MEIDNGNQARPFRFRSDAGAGAARPAGFLACRWETVRRARALRRRRAARPRRLRPSLSGSLKVVTTRMKPGYLRRNGVPYSGNAVLTEFFDRTTEPNGDSWLILTSMLDDPMYLKLPFC